MSRGMTRQRDDLHAVDDWLGATKRVPLTGLDVRRCDGLRTLEEFEEAVGKEEEERKKALGWAIKSETKDRRTAMIDLAATEKDVITLIENYDKNPWLFNAQNGTIDLETQTLRSHNRGDMLSMVSPVV